jgi:tRNA nucleotidyltransferase/poly(A) polymerase
LGHQPPAVPKYALLEKMMTTDEIEISHTQWIEIGRLRDRNLVLEKDRDRYLAEARRMKHKVLLLREALDEALKREASEVKRLKSELAAFEEEIAQHALTKENEKLKADIEWLTVQLQTAKHIPWM